MKAAAYVISGYTVDLGGWLVVPSNRPFITHRA
jgi:hypothetical protein